jgi:hypothetical protein
MNLQGRLNYNTATRGLRQRDIIEDQQFKLSFIYPVICDESVNQYSNLIRDFFTASILKEIFVHNSLNIVKLASQIPSIDEDAFETNDMLNTARFRNIDTSESTLKNNYNELQASKFELEKKIKKNTAIIRQLIVTDPKYSKLRPLVELITLNNLVEVPVIVGTDNNTFPTKFLTSIILFSALHEIKLNSSSNLDRIFQHIDNLDGFRTQIIFSNIVGTISQQNNRRSIQQRILNTIFGTDLDTREREANTYWNSQDNNLVDYDETLLLLHGIKNDITVNRSKLSKLLDKSHLMQKYKYFGFSNNSNDVISKVITKNNNNLSNIIHKSRIHFHNLFQIYAHAIILSIAHLFRNIDNPKLDLNEVITTTLYDSFSNNVDDLINQIFEEFNDRVLSSNNDPEELSKKMNVVGKDLLENMLKFFNNFDHYFPQNKMLPVMFTTYDYKSFYSLMNTLSTRCTKLYESSKNILNKLFTGFNFKDFTRTFETYVDNALSNFLRKILEPVANNASSLYNTFRYQSSAIFQNNIIPLGTVDPNTGLVNAYGISQKSINLFNSTVSLYIEDYKKVISSMFVYSIVTGLCEYVDVIKVDIKVNKMDALDDYNYILIIPSSNVIPLATIINTAAYQTLLKNIRQNSEIYRNNEKNRRNNSNELPLERLKFDAPQKIIQINTNYIKGITKYLVTRLDIPNIFIVDKKSKIIYYKVMFQTEFQQMSESNMQNFINYLLRMTEEQNSNSNNMSYF